MRIIAVDPGYERLGIAIMDKERKPLDKTRGLRETVIFSECFRTPKELPHSDRLVMVGKEIERVIDEYKPKALSIETLFFAKNQKTALLVAEARGVILYAARAKGLSVKEYMPNQIKIAVTSYGKSDKQQMMAMIPKIVELKQALRHDDEYDAIAAGITYFAIER